MFTYFKPGWAEGQNHKKKLTVSLLKVIQAFLSTPTPPPKKKFDPP